MMLEITIAHAVTKPMVRLVGEDLTAARWVSVVILFKFLTPERRTSKVQRPTSNRGGELSGAHSPACVALANAAANVYALATFDTQTESIVGATAPAFEESEW